MRKRRRRKGMRKNTWQSLLCDALHRNSSQPKVWRRGQLCQVPWATCDHGQGTPFPRPRRLKYVCGYVCGFRRIHCKYVGLNHHSSSLWPLFGFTTTTGSVMRVCVPTSAWPSQITCRAAAGRNSKTCSWTLWLRADAVRKACAELVSLRECEMWTEIKLKRTPEKQISFHLLLMKASPERGSTKTNNFRIR